MKKNNHLLKTVILFALSLTLLNLLSCQKSKKFQQLSEAQFSAKSELQANFCEPELFAKEGKNIFIFMMDSSYSQTVNDPTGKLRFGPLGHFLATKAPNSQDLFSLILFADEAKAAIPLSDQQQFTNQVSDIWSNKKWADLGFSNLLSAITLVKSQLTDYANKSVYEFKREHIKVHLFILSDGVPTIGDDQDVNGGKIPLKDFEKALDKTTGLYSLMEVDHFKGIYQSIQLNTVYYWGNYLGQSDIPENPEAKSLMEQLAKDRGKFIEFGKGSIVNYQLFFQSVNEQLKTLAGIYLSPEELVWDQSTGKLEIDTDRDGLSDPHEALLGSNPALVDSDSDGISDLVALKVFGQVCKQSGCQTASQLNPLCLIYAKDQLQGKGSSDVQDTDLDGLNNCEEELLQSSINIVDSNKNFIDDYTELKRGYNHIQSFNPNLDTDGDQVSDQEEFYQFYPHRYHNKDLAAQNFKPIKYQLSKKETEPGKKQCYHLMITQLPVHQGKSLTHLHLVFKNPLTTREIFFLRAAVDLSLNRTGSLEEKDFSPLGEVLLSKP